MIDVKWDMPLSLLQRSLYLMKGDGFRVVVKGHAAAIVSLSYYQMSVTLKDDSKVALLKMSMADNSEAKVLSFVKFIGAGKIMKDEVSSGRFVVTRPEEKMRWIVDHLVESA